MRVNQPCKNCHICEIHVVAIAVVRLRSGTNPAYGTIPKRKINDARMGTAEGPVACHITGIVIRTSRKDSGHRSRVATIAKFLMPARRIEIGTIPHATITGSTLLKLGRTEVLLAENDLIGCAITPPGK